MMSAATVARDLDDGGLEFVEEPPVLRFFMGKLRAKSDWPEKLAAKYRQDFGESL